MGVITAALCTAPTFCSSSLPARSAFVHPPAPSTAAAAIASLRQISRTQDLASSLRFAVTEFVCLRSPTQNRRGGKVEAKAKGFGELLQKKKKGGTEVWKSEEALNCPCGGGEESREYGACCARYHGDVVEPDATTLMKARYSAYARSKVDYVVRTTHRDNPDFGGEKGLAADVRATCERLRFTRLEILDSETTSENEAFVSFRVTYSLLQGGRGGEKKFLVEKSRFVKDGDRWLYRERIPISQASEAAWLVSTTPNYVDPEIARKLFSKGKLS